MKKNVFICSKMCKLYWSHIHLNCLYCMQMILFFLFHFIVFTFTWSLIRQLWTTNQIFSYFTTTDRPLPVLVAKHSHTHTHRGTVQVSQQALLSCQSSSFCGGTEGQDKLQRGWGAELPPEEAGGNGSGRRHRGTRAQSFTQ